jgi:hypothetical protein
VLNGQTARRFLKDSLICHIRPGHHALTSPASRHFLRGKARGMALIKQYL